MSQKIISLDSQILNSIQSCPKALQFRFLENLTPQEKATSLENGSLMHDMLEVYYTLKGGLEKNNKIFQEARALGLLVDNWFSTNAAHAALEIGRARSITMNLEIEEIENNLYQFQEYTNYYNYDNFEVLAVEGIATKVLYEDPDLKIIYNGKMDLVIRHLGKIIALDHKTSKKRSYPSLLNNQFLGYAFLLDIDTIMVNKIGFQKTLKPTERFQRDILFYTPDKIEAWRENTIFWVKMFLMHLESGYFPRNYTSCDKYSGCDFKKICETTEDNEEYIKLRDFIVGNNWDVAEILEIK